MPFLETICCDNRLILWWTSSWMRNKFQNENQILKTKEKSAMKSSWSVSGVKMDHISALETLLSETAVINSACPHHFLSQWHFLKWISIQHIYFCVLLYNAISILGPVTLNDGMTDKWWIGKIWKEAVMA